MERYVRPLLVVIASVALLLGTVAGVINHEVMDGPRFAAHVDAIRSDPAVARQAGRAITDQVLEIDPDLTAIRPLLQSAATALVRSDVFSPVVRRTAKELHASLTESDGGQILLRLSDIGTVLLGVVKAVAPSQASRLPSRIDVRLGGIGSQELAARTLHWAYVTEVASWSLPLLAGLAYAGAVLWPRNRRAAIRQVGWAIVLVGLVIGLAAFVTSAVVGRAGDATLSSALRSAMWSELDGSFWWASAILVGGGLLIVAASAVDVPMDVASWRDAVVHPSTRRSQAIRGTVLVLIGAGLLVKPGLLLKIAATVAAVGLVVLGIRELAVAVRGKLRDRPRVSRPSVQILALVAAGLLLVGLVGFNASPADESIGIGGDGQRTLACNGHVELCGRPYDEVAFPATHNSMSAADASGWFRAKQPTGLVGQLDDGIRVFLIDSWYGQQTQRDRVIASTDESRAEAIEELRANYGDAFVDSALRLRRAVGLEPHGAETPYLCHGLCELGSTKWEPLMVQVRKWLAAHPREVVTFIIQDEVSPADTAAVLKNAGLDPMLHVQRAGQPWPTLGQMIASGRRVVVFMENHGGGSRYPQLLQGFDWIQDNPFKYTRAGDFSCDRARGRPSASLLLLNHWLSRPQHLVSDAAKVNAFDVLWPHVNRCRKQRGMLPNYVAVDYYNHGDLFKVVDKLNGF